MLAVCPPLGLRSIRVPISRAVPVVLCFVGCDVVVKLSVCACYLGNMAARVATCTWGRVVESCVECDVAPAAVGGATSRVAAASRRCRCQFLYDVLSSSFLRRWLELFVASCVLGAGTPRPCPDEIR